MNNNEINKKESSPRILLIARVSDPSQLPSLPGQTRMVYEYAEKQGWEEGKDFKYLEFDETAYKGDARVKFEKLVIEPVKQATETMILVCHKCDRFSRDTSDDHKSFLVRQTRAGKIELHFPGDQLIIDKDSVATEKFRFDMNISLAAYYSASISDNVKRRFNDKLAKGEKPGRANVGYLNNRIDKDHTSIIVDPERAPFVVKAYKLRRQGMTIIAITEQLKKEGFTVIGHNGKGKNEVETTKGIVQNSNAVIRPISKSTMGDLLKNPFYYGVLKYNGKLYQHKCEPLVSKKEWDEAQVVREFRNVNRTQYGAESFAMKDAICGDCGLTISFYWAKEKVYGQCSHRRGACSTPHLAESKLLPQVVSTLEKLVIDESTMTRILDRVKAIYDNEQLYFKNSIAEVEKMHKKVERRLENLYEDRLDDRISAEEYDKRSEALKQEAEELSRQLKDLKRDDKSFIVTLPYLLKLAAKAPETFKSVDAKRQSGLIKRVADRIIINGYNVDLRLKKPFQALYNFYNEHDTDKLISELQLAKYELESLTEAEEEQLPQLAEVY